MKGQTVTHIVPDGKPHKFETKNKQFLIDGEPTLLVSGEMHFGRVQPEDWETRIKQAKALGLNTISFYLFWNQVEPREGEFNFTGMNDVRRVIKLCQDNGLWVIFRPGPYCCAEVEYGGIPYWTLKYPNVKIRTTDPQYVEWSRKYIEEVYKQIADLQVTHGGPILMVQIENEYGIVADGNNDYMVELRKIFKNVGFDVPLFTCDPGSVPAASSEWVTPAMRLPGVVMGRNGLKTERDGQITQAANGDFPVIAPEVYTAWFSGWGAKIEHRQPIPQQLTWVNFLLDHNYSFNLFLAFGGTNYGFYNGCNEYLPVQTSYDYDAPIDEAGRTTEKYNALRALFTKRLGIAPPPVPPEPAVIEIPAIRLTETEPVIDSLPSRPTKVSVKPLAMEELDQDYGFVLYRKQFPNGLKGKLELKQAMDYTITMVNGKTIGKSFVGYGPDSNKVNIDENKADIDEFGPVTLDLLVYNLGRISVPVSASTQWRAHKGLIGGAFLDGKELTDWQDYSLPMNPPVNLKFGAIPQAGPTFYHATFTLDKVGETFLDMRNWGFGAVWVNGHNLGRFWDRGGLRSLFLSSHFLKQGANDIVVLELHDAPKVPEVTGVTHIVEEPPVPFAYRLDRTDLPLVAPRRTTTTTQ